jgi:DNA polymerase-3 subunit alpha
LADHAAMAVASESGKTGRQGAGFVHLRTHSAYSLLEGALHIKTLAGLCTEHAMPAVGLTDTGNLFGALEFSEAMAEKGIQPIVGTALAIDFGDDPNAHARQKAGSRRDRPSIVLLAQDEAGYGNLMRLSSRSFLDTDAAEAPHVPLDLLRAHADGLIALTGGPSGPVDQAILARQPELARARLELLCDLFGDRLYIELQRHGTVEER